MIGALRVNSECWVFLHAFLLSANCIKRNVFKSSFRNTIRMLNSLDPNKAQHFVGPDQGTDRLQRLSATLCLLVSSAHNLCKQIGARSGLTIMSGLIWIQSVCHSDGIPERVFQKSWFWKKSADEKKKRKNSPGGNELNNTYFMALLSPLEKLLFRLVASITDPIWLAFLPYNRIKQAQNGTFVCLFDLILYVPVNIFSVI